MDLSYPQVGFHFSVVFELFPQVPNDIKFQEVSGLTAEVETEPYNEGGENRLVHQLPVRTKSNDLTLKRGRNFGSGVLHWFRKAIEKQEYSPTNIMISLLDENSLPLCNWYIVHAIPKRLEVSAFNAERSEVIIETMVMQYHYYKYYDPAETAMDIAGALTGAVSVNLGF